MVKKTIQLTTILGENIFASPFPFASFPVASPKVLEETNQILAPKVENPTENDEDAEDEDEIANEKKMEKVNSKREKPRLSKKARKQMKEGNSVGQRDGEDDDFDIKVSGEAKRETPGQLGWMDRMVLGGWAPRTWIRG